MSSFQNIKFYSNSQKSQIWFFVNFCFISIFQGNRFHQNPPIDENKACKNISRELQNLQMLDGRDYRRITTINGMVYNFQTQMKNIFQYNYKWLHLDTAATTGLVQEIFAAFFRVEHSWGVAAVSECLHYKLLKRYLSF